MTNIPYTPGPWYYDWYFIVAADPQGVHDDIYIATIATEDEDDRIASPEAQDANRSLIAAAPSLLVALQDLLATIELLAEEFPICAEISSGTAALIARSTIARATDAIGAETNLPHIGKLPLGR